jgi:hypothetical protein
MGVQGNQQLDCKKIIRGCQFSIIKTELSVVHRGIYIRNNSPRLVWNEYELKGPRSEVEGQLVEAFVQSSSVHERLLSFCAAFSNLPITPSLEVEIMRCLLGWNLDFKELPVMYNVALVSS